MKLSLSWIGLTAALAAAGCAARSSDPGPALGGAAPAANAVADDDDDGDSEEAVALDAVPSAAMKAAKGAVSGITFSSAERETENGVVVYSLKGTAGGKTYEVEVTADGKVTEVEDGDDADDDEDD
jgi:uncharacterized membrane protein YkoI